MKIVLCAMSMIVLCSSASADTITAMATEINPEHLEKTASYARILGYNEETNALTVELIVPETFRRDEVLALQVGDSIYTGGQEILIRTIERHDDDSLIVINDENLSEHADDSVYLYQDPFDYNQNFKPEEYANYTWTTLAVIDCPVTESLLFLDYIDEKATGDALRLPMVYTARELVDKMLSEQASDEYFVGLAIDNVYVVFDGEGNLATIQRYFVSWQ